ncbi:hypothetical protein GJU39_01100 [Pedobacter petrophilus]|uniref:Uncharacterized protein n=1 Tax=Pedobacter petrophilus TaxID=1908241 RepID=A0A7K0FTV6_9SPHI|nr:hypothetical protein [Pedobacter petrophilus]MRX74670.1 hypothetical protein [Pedobacter petrophilus]
MSAELIQELQLLQNSRANKFDDLTDRFRSSVDQMTEQVQSSISHRGKMLMLLEKRLNFSLLKKFKNNFFKI